MSDTNGFSKEYIDKMSDKLAAISTAVTGVSLDGKGGTSSIDGAINMLTCQPGSDCYRTKHTKELKDVWTETSARLKNGDIDLSRAEKNYYIYNEGKNGGQQIYDKLIIDRFAKTADVFKQNSIDMQQQFMADLTQTLKQYQSEIIFQGQSAKLLKTRQEEQNILKKNINYYQKIVQTGERKVVYANRNMDSLYIYRRIMFFIYYSAIIFFVVFGNFITDKLYMKWSVWLLLVLFSIFPIILNMLIRWLFIIGDTISYWYSDPQNGYGRFQRYKDPYYDMGNPFDETPPEAPKATKVLPASIMASMSPELSANLSALMPGG